MSRFFITSLLLGSFLLAGLAFLPQSTPVQAQNSSPSSELREIIKQRLEKTLETDTSDRMLGMIGSVTRVTNSTFTMLDPSGRERTIVIDADSTTFAGTTQVKSFADVSIESGIAVIGTSSDGVLVNARRIIPAPTPFGETRRVALGSIQAISGSELTLVERGSNNTTSFNITSTTRFEDILGNVVPRSAVQEDESILVVIEKTAAGDPFAKRIRLLVAANAEDN